MLLQSLTTWWKKISVWLDDIDDHDKHAKQMRRDDRAGLTDFEQVQKGYERDEQRRLDSKLDA